MTMMTSLMLGSGVKLVLFLLVFYPFLVTAQFFGQYQYGQQVRCTWGTRAVAVPGQCGAYQCLSQWFLGISYAAQCPYGTMFSMTAGQCISPMALAAQCSAAVQTAQIWN
ncbi:hypothetical protein ACOMHN_020156 [Nucella lapillus]